VQNKFQKSIFVKRAVAPLADKKILTINNSYLTHRETNINQKGWKQRSYGWACSYSTHN